MSLAVVTGAARGVGAATVARFVARGWTVLAVDACLGDREPGAAQATEDDLAAVVASHDGRVLGAVVDVRDRAALHAVVDEAVAAHGPLVAVVAAAAIIDGGHDLWLTETAVLDGLWQTDLVGVWNTASATVPHLLAAAGTGQQPAFCAIASAAGHRGLWHLGAYCIVKHAVVGLVRALAADLHGRGVTVAGVSPGSTDTDMLAATARLYALPDVGELAQGQTTNRPLAPEAVARVAEAACTLGPAVHGSVLDATAGMR